MLPSFRIFSKTHQDAWYYWCLIHARQPLIDHDRVPDCFTSVSEQEWEIPNHCQQQRGGIYFPVHCKRRQRRMLHRYHPQRWVIPHRWYWYRPVITVPKNYHKLQQCCCHCSGMPRQSPWHPSLMVCSIPPPPCFTRGWGGCAGSWWGGFCSGG